MEQQVPLTTRGTVPMVHQRAGAIADAFGQLGGTGMLSDPRRESFARNMAMGCNRMEAGRRSNWPESGLANRVSRLLKEPNVLRRIKELCLNTNISEIASKDWVLCEVIENHRLARKSGDINVSRQCLELVARLKGYLVERRDTSNLQVRVNLTDPEQLRAAIRDSLQSLPLGDQYNVIELAPPELAEAIKAELPERTSGVDQAAD